MSKVETEKNNAEEAQVSTVSLKKKYFFLTVDGFLFEAEDWHNHTSYWTLHNVVITQAVYSSRDDNPIFYEVHSSPKRRTGEQALDQVTLYPQHIISLWEKEEKQPSIH